MAIRVIVPPSPIVEVGDLPDGDVTDDFLDQALIAAVTEGIAGPAGWLGRSLGPQTLELTLEGWCGRLLRLPSPPVIGDVTVKYLDVDGVEQTLDEANYRLVDSSLWFASGFVRPSLECAPDAVRIRYRAGYDGLAIADGGTGPVPDRAKQAIILSVWRLKALGAQNPYLSVDEVQGIGRREYTLTDQANKVILAACDSLLSTLREYV